MSTDLFAWAPPAARNTDPETSHQAAERKPNVRTKDRMAVLRTHAANQAGLTDFELAVYVGRQQTSAGKRRGELRDLGLIKDSGERRPSPSGSSAIVWKITDDGSREAEKL